MNGVRQFCENQCFYFEILFFQFLHILHFSESLRSKSTQMLRPRKRNSGVLFNDTLLSFALRETRPLSAKTNRKHGKIRLCADTYTLGDI